MTHELHQNKPYQFLSLINVGLASGGYIIEEGLMIFPGGVKYPLIYLKSTERREDELLGRKLLRLVRKELDNTAF